MVENFYGKQVKTIRTDGGGEYCSREFEDFLVKAGIIHQKTIPLTPEQNGLAERKNRTLVKSVRCMLSDSALPKKFWAEAVSTANYVLNRAPSTPIGSTPYEMLNGNKPNVGHLKVFGCVAYMHIPKEKG